MHEVRANGNGNNQLPNGFFQMIGDAPLALMMNLWCEGENSMTWQMAANAMVALEEFLNVYPFSGVTFQIFDGARKVGMGQIN